jgi:tetratricopeptide (TPR) repeat protein
MNDFWSIPVTNATAEVIDALDHFSTRLVRFDAGVDAILEAASLFPSVPLVRAYAAALLLYAQTDPARREATQHLDAIRFNGVHLAAREAALVSALEAWAKNEHLRALDIFEALLLDYPQDLPAAKMAEYLYYIIGQQFAGPRYLAQMNRLADFHGDQPDFLSMWAFAHELCGEYDRAQALAEQAIDGERRNPWAHHCLSHVTHRQGKIEEGRRMMERFPQPVARPMREGG